MRPFFVSILIGITTLMSAQHVNSKSYDVLLKGLLSHSVKAIDVSDLDSMNNVQLVDSREPEEYKVSHMKGATFVGYKKLNEEALQKLDKDKPVVVYCSVGYRSEKVAEKLQKQGFEEVYNLYGGIFEWVNRGKPVYNSTGQTNDIHPYSWLWGQWLERGNKTSEPEGN